MPRPSRSCTTLPLGSLRPSRLSESLIWATCPSSVAHPTAAPRPPRPLLSCRLSRHLSGRLRLRRDLYLSVRVFSCPYPFVVPRACAASLERCAAGGLAPGPGPQIDPPGRPRLSESLKVFLDPSESARVCLSELVRVCLSESVGRFVPVWVSPDRRPSHSIRVISSEPFIRVIPSEPFLIASFHPRRFRAAVT